jgi:hypothetical protein
MCRFNPATATFTSLAALPTGTITTAFGGIDYQLVPLNNLSAKHIPLADGTWATSVLRVNPVTLSGTGSLAIVNSDFTQILDILYDSLFPGSEISSIKVLNYDYHYISGNVMDGASPLVGAPVCSLNADGKIATMTRTNAQGDYTLVTLDADPRDLAVYAPGGKSALHAAVPVTA